MILPTKRKNKPLNVNRARIGLLDKLQDILKGDSETVQVSEIDRACNQEKNQEPIVKAIKEQTETIKLERKPKHSVQVMRMPARDAFRSRVFSTPDRGEIVVWASASPLPKDPEEIDVFENPTTTTTSKPAVESEQ